MAPDQGDQNNVVRMKEELAQDTRDISDIWNDAIKNYKGIVGLDLKPTFKSVDDMMTTGTAEMESLHRFRHNKKKVDKLRSLFAQNLDYIQKGADQLVSAATPAFPPAAAIGTALTLMLTACKKQSADYDVVTAFFEDMNAFLRRITILESRLPKYQAYRNCLMDVFRAVLEMCGFSTKYIELGRFKKWVINMIKGADSELGDARKKMDTTLSRLQAATEYAILGNTEELQRMNSDLQQNQDMQTQMMEDQTRMLESVLESQETVRNDLVNIQKLLMVFQERRQDDTRESTMNKPATSSRVRSYLPDAIDPIHEYGNIVYSFIPGTCTWLFDEPEWEAWNGRTSRILAVEGPPGAGKSHLAACAYDHLVELARSDPNTCVTHFYFREGVSDLNFFHHAINWTIIQLAEQNTSLCDRINAELEREDIDDWNPLDWRQMWDQLVRPWFSGASPARLQIVWDGLDELEETAQDELLQCFSLIQGSTDLNLADMKTLIWNHLNNDAGLRKFSRYTKERVSNTFEEKASEDDREESIPTVKYLLCWLAFSFRPLSLGECLALIRLDKGTTFDLEQELQRSCLTNFLKIADVEERLEERLDFASPEHLVLAPKNAEDPATYNDYDLPLKFQERSMRQFFRNACPCEIGLRTSSTGAHRQMFIACSQLICTPSSEAPHALKMYACRNWMAHLSWTKLSEDSDCDRIQALEALGAIMTNRDNIAKVFETLEIDYDQIRQGLQQGDFLDNLVFWAKLAKTLGSRVNAETSKWANSVVLDKMSAFIPLVKGHCQNWLQADDLRSIKRAYRSTRSALKLTHYSQLVNEETAEQDESADFDDDSDEAGVPTLILLTEIRLDMHGESVDNVRNSIDECLAIENVSPQLLRNALLTKGRVENFCDDLDAATWAYAEARKADPDQPMPGDILQDESELFIQRQDDPGLIELVKQWKPLERLAAMTWQYDWDSDWHQHFQRGAGKVSEQTFMVEAYEEVIKLLANLRAAPPLQYQLVVAHWKVRGDLDAARELLNEVLDSKTTGIPYSFTNEDPSMTLVTTTLLMSEIIYEQFRRSADPARKTELFAEVKALRSKNMAHSIASNRSVHGNHSIIVARMARRMASALEVQDTLQRAFDICYDGLVDNVRGNDLVNLRNLASVLTMLDGLEREAQILVSAFFSQLDPDVVDKDDMERKGAGVNTVNEPDEDSGDPGDNERRRATDKDEPNPENQGDLAGVACCCDGECDPRVEWSHWHTPLYMCVICCNTTLCKDCYDRRQEYNRGIERDGGRQRQQYNRGIQCGGGREYCGFNHKYVLGPVEGWKGIKEGILRIEGEEPIKFRDWLEDLKNNKSEKAWDRFRLTEG
ncbi:hypothetical protein EDD37DRAFT_607841 [Exophiala viscosa]|uniref:uncharacterized protein n=1 Tax=Exophiala viscosa TaxID=2486360 RepID=UPI002191BCF4|nr:hypothetical protein EDD37DRAFT_607841 [Exophiala viscosa]